MKLTQRQEQAISLFLRKSAETVAGLSPQARELTIGQIRARLQQAFQHLGDRTPSDQEVAVILNRCRVTPTGWQTPAAAEESEAAPAGKPASSPATAPRETQPSEPANPASVAARPVAPSHPPADSGSPSETRRDERVLLGVCESLASRKGLDVGGLRAGFVVLGVFTGPFALFLYLYLYFDKYSKAGRPGKPPFDRSELIGSVANTAAIAFGMYISAFAVLRIGEQMYLRFLSNELILGSWGWFYSYQHLFFFWAIFCLLPLSLLSALPLAHGWAGTISKTVRAGLVLYAVLICIGAAASIAGTIVVIARDFVG